MSPPKLNKRARRRLVRRSLIAGNILLLVLVAAFVLYNRSASSTVQASTLNSVTATAGSNVDPLDQLSESQIALTAAQMTDLPELTAIRNQADSDSLLLSVVPNDSTALSKPQIVSLLGKSRADIIHYTVKKGDSVTSLSAKFHLTPGSIRWSNGISGDSLTAGSHLLIPPVNGIVYKVKSGDTPTTLASQYQSSKQQIIDFNDAELSGIKPGELIVIPNGQVEPLATTPVFGFGSFTATYGGNGYDYGYCTWYVANHTAVPTNWGNANTWDDYARLSGWTVSTVPVRGAIAQTDAGWEGHVAYVEAVNSNGTVWVSEMNSYGQVSASNSTPTGGWGVVDWKEVSASTFRYIYH